MAVMLISARPSASMASALASISYGPFLALPAPGTRSGGWGTLLLRPKSYVSSQWISPESVGLYVHEKINDTSFHIGDYEAIKGAAIDPYVAMRDAYVQYRKKLIER